MRRLVFAALLASVAAAPARAAVTQIGIEAFEDVWALGFEERSNAEVLDIQYLGLELTFSTGFELWEARSYLPTYGQPLADAAAALGLGSIAAEIYAGEQLMTFATPVQRVGFYLGSNVSVQVPVFVTSAGAGPATPFVLSVAADELVFFGFEDPAGITSILFEAELTDDFSSLLDGLRFEREPTGTVERIALGDFPGDETVLSFQEFDQEQYVVDDDFAAEGVLFDGDQGAWQAEFYSDYGDGLVAAAEAIGAGDRGLFHLSEGETIAFDPPVTQVGFHFGSNEPVRVPIQFFRDGAEVGTFTIVVPPDQMGFEGFERPGGIDEIRFGDELVNGYVSNLDLLRFAVPEPAGGAPAAFAALALLARRRYTRSRPG